MSDNLVVAFDVISFVAFSAALFLVLREDFAESQPYSGIIKLLFGLASFVYVFVAFSNILEHTGVTSALDAYEDYLELLFVPLVAYAVYSMHTARLYNSARRSAELMKAEHGLLTTIVDTSPTGIMLVTSAGGIAFANDMARSVLGIVTDEDSGALVMPEDLVCVSTQNPFDRPLSLERLAQGGSFAGSVCIVETGSRKVALSVSASPLGGEGSASASAGSVVSFVDVSEREQARQELLDAQSRYSLDLERTVDERTVELLELNRALEDANRAKREFLAMVSHELKTPLGAMQGFTGLLLNGDAGPVTAEQVKQLQMVRDSSKELLGFVERLLEFERVESGHTVVRSERVTLSTVTDQVVQLMVPLAQDRGVTLETDAPDDLIAETDAGLLGQIVRNLVSNAVKFTPRGGRVTVRSFAEGSIAGISVTDTGTGITASDLGRIFEPFAQLDPPSGEKPPGTGLGLAICRELASALGGSIEVSSVPGEGSVFTVRLPFDPAAV